MRGVRPFLVAAMCSSTLSATAQPFKCTVDGKVVYQQARCIGGETVNTTGAGKANPDSSGAQAAQREVVAYKRQQIVADAVAQGRVLIGMRAEEVLASWGRPTKINKTISAGGISEQWVYRAGRGPDGQYVYLDNGVVRSLQTTE